MVARAEQTSITVQVQMMLGVGLSSEIALRTIPAAKKGLVVTSPRKFLIGPLGDWDHASAAPLL